VGEGPARAARPRGRADLQQPIGDIAEELVAVHYKGERGSFSQGLVGRPDARRRAVAGQGIAPNRQEDAAKPNPGVTGDDCYVMTAYVRDVEHLEQLIDQFAAFGQTTSSTMQSSPVPRRGLSLQSRAM